jgi:hypothetical protein
MPAHGQLTFFASYMLQDDRFRYLAMQAELADFPLKLDYQNQKNINIMGGFGVRLGDTVLGIQAAHMFRKLKAPDAIFHCHLVPDNTYAYPDLYSWAGIAHSFLPLTSRDKPLIHADFCDLFHRQDLAHLSLQDRVFAVMGFAPHEILPDDKAPRWLTECIRPDERARDTVWLVPVSSDPVRCFSEKLVADILALDPRIRIMPRDQTLRDYIAKLAGCRALVSTDTSAYHIAAAWDKPAFVVFDQDLIVQEGFRQLSHVKSSMRVSYYRNVTPVDVWALEDRQAKEAAVLERLKGWLAGLC